MIILSQLISGVAMMLHTGGCVEVTLQGTVILIPHPRSRVSEFAKVTPWDNFHSISNNFVGVVGGTMLFKI